MSGTPPPGLSAYRRIRRVHRNTRGQTEVWFAEAPSGVPVALKLISRGSDPDEHAYRAQRFADEVAAGLTLRHEHLRRLFHYGSEESPVEGFPDGVDYLVFEWVEGPTLQEVLDEVRASGPMMSAADWRDLAHAVSNGLDTLHCADPPWVHRDVKPANVLLPGGEFRRARLADLGVAWREGSARHSHVAGLASGSGTAPYMAPEQLENAPVITTAADQYALALLLWEAATGWVPLSPHTLPGDRHGMRRGDLLQLRREGRLQEAFTLSGDPAPALEGVLVRALAPRREDRWEDVQAFWLALHEAGVTDRRWDPDISVRSASRRTAAGVPRPRLPPALPPAHEVPEVWLAQRTLLESFRGREVELARLQAWLRSDPTAPYRVVLGPQGQGKSALMAKLAATEGATRTPGLPSGDGSVCLFHMIGAHGEPRRILQALLGQAEHALGIRSSEEVYASGILDLRNALVAALERLSARARVSIVLDGLDELPPEGRALHFLPRQLPSGVRCVLSARPDAPLLAILRAAVQSFEEDSLSGVSPADGGQIAELVVELPWSAIQSAVDLEAILRQTEGNALVLTEVLRSLRPRIQAAVVRGERLFLMPDEIAGSIQDVFRSVYGALLGRSGGTGPRQPVRYALVQILACAVAPLNPTQLRALLRIAGHVISREEVDGILEAISPHLTNLDGRYRLFHQGLGEHIRQNALDPDEVAEVQGWFLRWSAEPLQASYHEEYGRIHHEERATALARSGAAAALVEALHGWADELTSAGYVQLRVSAGHVYELQVEMVDFTLRATDLLNEAGVGATELGAKIDTACAWAVFLDERTHVLARAPHLLAQELRNAPQGFGLRAAGESLPLPGPALLIRSEVEEPLGYYIRRRTLPIPPVEALAVGADGERARTIHDDGRSVGRWDLSTGQGKVLELPPGIRAQRLGADRASGSLVLAVEVGRGGTFLVERPGIAAPEKIRWADQYLVAMAAGGGGVVAAFHPSGAGEGSASTTHLRRIPLVRGGAAWEVSLSGRVRQVAIGTDGSQVAVVLQEGEEAASSEIRILDGSSGAEISRVQLDEPTGWIGLSPTSLLVSAHRDTARVWAVPHLRELGEFDRCFRAMRMTCFHPTAPRALLFENHAIRVLDLESRRIIRTERWREQPGNHAQLAEGSEVLIGDLGRFGDLLREPAPLAVWELPPDLWEAAGPVEAPTPATARAVQLQQGQCLLSRPADACLVESWVGEPLPRRIFVGSQIGWTTGVAKLDETHVVLSGETIDVLDVGRGVVLARLRSNTDELYRLEFEQDAWRAYWRPLVRELYRGAPEATRAAGDASIADALARGIPVVSLDAPEAEHVLAPLPWRDKENGSAFGVSTLDLAAGRWEDFIELPESISPERWEFMPGGRFLLYEPAIGEAYVVHAGSGEILVEFRSDEHPLEVLDERRLLCLDDWGRSFLLDVVSGGREKLGVDFGDLAHVREEFRFAVRPDLHLVAWISREGVHVAELRSGAQVAFLPVHGVSGSLSWDDSYTLSVRSAEGRTMVLALEAYPR